MSIHVIYALHSARVRVDVFFFISMTRNLTSKFVYMRGILLPFGCIFAFFLSSFLCHFVVQMMGEHRVMRCLVRYQVICWKFSLFQLNTLHFLFLSFSSFSDAVTESLRHTFRCVNGDNSNSNKNGKKKACAWRGRIWRQREL